MGKEIKLANINYKDPSETLKFITNNYNFNCGWVSPDGTFYGCGYAQHEIVVMKIFRTTTAKIEELGFARLTEGQPFFQCTTKYKSKQIDKIIEIYETKKANYALKLFLDEINN